MGLDTISPLSGEAKKKLSDLEYLQVLGKQYVVVVMADYQALVGKQFKPRDAPTLIQHP